MFPWIAEPEATPLTETITDPVSGATITLPRLNGLRVSEVLFMQWAADRHEFTQSEHPFTGTPKMVLELTQFCHYFLCLRLERADWGGDGLLFPDRKPLTADDSLMMTSADGQRKAAPLYLLYLIYAFVADEQARWQGKLNAGMLSNLTATLTPASPLTGSASTGISSESIPAIPDSPAATLAAAPSTSSKAPSKARGKAA